MVTTGRLDFLFVVIRSCGRFAHFEVFSCPEWNVIGNTEGRRTKTAKAKQYMNTAILIIATLVCFGLLRKTIDWFETI
ncbi:hypothetical protein GCM10023092_03760 [Rurimicrobium arvi]|uniref:Uncharacterized protein n=1 Tax=Rurimicrobium arvi TaxID=2049916 RepID=A0ABP8MFG1_9BACT